PTIPKKGSKTLVFASALFGLVIIGMLGLGLRFAQSNLKSTRLITATTATIETSAPIPQNSSPPVLTLSATSLGTTSLATSPEATSSTTSPVPAPSATPAVTAQSVPPHAMEEPKYRLPPPPRATKTIQDQNSHSREPDVPPLVAIEPPAPDTAT